MTGFPLVSVVSRQTAQSYRLRGSRRFHIFVDLELRTRQVSPPVCAPDTVSPCFEVSPIQNVRVEHPKTFLSCYKFSIRTQGATAAEQRFLFGDTDVDSVISGIKDYGGNSNRRSTDGLAAGTSRGRMRIGHTAFLVFILG